MTAARTALAAKKYDDALLSAGAASKLFPGDKTSQDLVKEIQAAKAAAAAEDVARKAEYTSQMTAALAAMQAGTLVTCPPAPACGTYTP